MQEALRTDGADALLVATNVNLFYTAGRVFMGFIYLPAEGTPWFFVRRPVGLQGDTVADVRNPNRSQSCCVTPVWPCPGASCSNPTI